jgi:hypothetical protein
MSDRPPQNLSDAFGRIITMILAEVRARGWRRLKGLPKIWLTVMVFRRYGEALVALMAAYRAGKLPPAPPVPVPAPEPAPWIDVTEWQEAFAQPAAPRRAVARSVPAARARRRPAELAAALPRAARRAAVRPWPALRTPHPVAVLAPPAGILVSGRST